MQWRRRRKIGGWCLLTRWQNQRNNFSKIFSFLWMILEAMVMNMMKISALRPLWASWACGRGWSWRRGSPSASSLLSLVTMMVLTVALQNVDDDKEIWLGKRCFFICIQIHALYLCMYVCLYFLYIFIGICVHSCLYFLYIFSWVDSLPCGAMAGSKREGRWERFRITKLSSIESSTLWERFDSKYKIFFNKVIMICSKIQNILKRNYLITILEPLHQWSNYETSIESFLFF